MIVISLGVWVMWIDSRLASRRQKMRVTIDTGKITLSKGTTCEWENGEVELQENSLYVSPRNRSINLTPVFGSAERVGRLDIRNILSTAHPANNPTERTVRRKKESLRF